MKKKFGKVQTILALGAAFILIWTGGWYLLAWRLDRGLSAWLGDSSRNSALRISAARLEIRGYPFGFRAELSQPEIELVDSDHSWVNGRWRSDAAEARFRPLSLLMATPQLTTIRLVGSQVGGFHILGFVLTGQLDSDSFLISFDDSAADPLESRLGAQKSLAGLKPQWRVTVSGDRLRFANGLNEEVYSFAQVATEIAAYAPVVENSTAPSLVLSLRLKDGQWLRPEPVTELVIAENGTGDGSGDGTENGTDDGTDDGSWG